MPTSGVTTWSMTAQAMIVHALRKNGIISLNEAPTDPEITECIIVLNGIIKSLSVGSYLSSTGSVTIPAGDASGTLPGSVMDILSARVVVDPNFQRPLTAWGRSEYLELPNKTQQGEPTAYYTDNQRDVIAMYVWPVPTRETTVIIEYNREPETITAATETIDFPQKYNEFLFSELALNCAGIFGKEPPPLLIARTQKLRTDFEDEERPESYIIESGFNY